MRINGKIYESCNLTEAWRIGNGKVIHQTDKSLLFKTTEYGFVRIWQDALHDDSEAWDIENREGNVVVKAWFAAKRGWI